MGFASIWVTPRNKSRISPMVRSESKWVSTNRTTAGEASGRSQCAGQGAGNAGSSSVTSISRKRAESVASSSPNSSRPLSR